MDSQMLILSLSIKVFPSSHAVSALHAADSSDCQMIILFKKKKKKKSSTKVISLQSVLS